MRGKFLPTILKLELFALTVNSSMLYRLFYSHSYVIHHSCPSNDYIWHPSLTCEDYDLYCSIPCVNVEHLKILKPLARIYYSLGLQLKCITIDLCDLL